MKRRWRWLLKAYALFLLVGAVVLIASTGWLAQLGGRVTGARLARVERSPQWRDGAFVNSVPTHTLSPGGFWASFEGQMFGKEQRVPEHALKTEARQAADFPAAPGELRATWMGHATVLLEIDGVRVLTDPTWSRRASPSSLVGPTRFFDPVIALDALPAIDVVVISHDHYDHLDMHTVRALAKQPTVTFVVPLGIGAHLEAWGIAPSRIVELEWNERTAVAGLTLVATPGRHYSGRRITDENATLWATWVIAGPEHRVFFSGDTGYFPGFARIGDEHGPFDLVLVKIGAYGPTWPDIHMTPEEAVQASIDLHARVMLPIHWATFNLAFHRWDEPVERAIAAAQKLDVKLALPRPGQRLDPAAPLPAPGWWRP